MVFDQKGLMECRHVVCLSVCHVLNVSETQCLLILIPLLKISKNTSSYIVSDAHILLLITRNYSQAHGIRQRQMQLFWSRAAVRHVFRILRQVCICAYPVRIYFFRHNWWNTLTRRGFRIQSGHCHFGSTGKLVNPIGSGRRGGESHDPQPNPSTECIWS